MIVTGVLGRVAGTVLTGLVGAAAYDAVKALARQGRGREAAVATTVVALRGVRSAERQAESVRLAAADVVAEARARMGEQAPVPATAPRHDHDH